MLPVKQKNKPKNKHVESHGPTSILEYQKTHKVATKTIPYKIYTEILFQKVASGYLLHFVQDGSSKNVLENTVCAKIPKTTTTKIKIALSGR